MKTKNDKLNFVRGSLIGGAAGDALGYPVEFNSYQSILAKYGELGIKEYKLCNDVAEVSDDTQMTLFTANAILMAQTRSCMRGIGGALEYYVEYGYIDWYLTQTESYENVMKRDLSRHTWISALPRLYSRRAPGNTCLTAIHDIMERRTPANNSKGCGGVMRVAPYGLFCACHDSYYSIEETDVAGGEIARLTHKHPLGWIPAIILTHIIYRIVKDREIQGLDKNYARKLFTRIVIEALNSLPNLMVLNNVSETTWNKKNTIGEVFSNDVKQQVELMEQALSLATNNHSDIENIRCLGEGWVGEEALAIATYAVARHIDSFEDALVASVNHDGDSDSTGSIAGNIIGAIVGYDAIPTKFKENLELHDVIIALADDLHQGCITSEYDPDFTPEKGQWLNRYCEMIPAGFENEFNKNNRY